MVKILIFFFPNTKSSKLVTITRNNHLHLILQLRHILLKFTHGHISLWTIEVFSQLQFLVFFYFFIYIFWWKNRVLTNVWFHLDVIHACFFLLKKKKKISTGYFVSESTCRVQTLWVTRVRGERPPVQRCNPVFSPHKPHGLPLHPRRVLWSCRSCLQLHALW